MAARSQPAVIRVYDATSNVIKAHDHASDPRGLSKHRIEVRDFKPEFSSRRLPQALSRTETCFLIFVRCRATPYAFTRLDPSTPTLCFLLV